MGRGISFDYERALDQATRQFWKTGYAGTSLRDLLKATGIGEGSFYNTLGNKKQLYRNCLKHYAETEGGKRAEALTSAPTTGAGLRAMFGVVLDCLDDPATPSRLCMMAAMISEDVLADDDLKALAESSLADLHAGLTSRLLKDRDEGIVRSNLNPAATASVIITYAQGLWRMAMVDFDRPSFERQIEVFLTSMGL
jgi:TetR/AcrR family transcriptional repressor of nem operon